MPDNSLKTFWKMIDLSVPWIELDVYYSKDYIPIVYHGDDYGNLEQENIEANVFKGKPALEYTREQL